jgi:formylglycine-generating enzyme required for sulfatase activity
MPFPNWSDHWFTQTEKEPVVWIAWEDAVDYCNWRSKQAGLPPAYDAKTRMVVDPAGHRTTDVRTVRGFRLPTEAEWEFAAREGGRKVRFGNGQDVARAAEINFNAAEGYFAYLERGSNRGVTLAVGSLGPNRLGLYDMAGNAWEWCTDTGALYTADPQVNPCNQKGTNHIIRGGTYQSAASACRAAARVDWWPFAKCAASGFRLAVADRRDKPRNRSGPRFEAQRRADLCPEARERPARPATLPPTPGQRLGQPLLLEQRTPCQGCRTDRGTPGTHQSPAGCPEGE